MSKFFLLREIQLFQNASAFKVDNKISYLIL